jgi:peptidoglycan/xylan/chitin deacetylase (PgdA/CDA1 family)
MFLCGSWIHHHRQVAKQLGQDTLFELANHTYFHPILTRLTPDSICREIQTTQDTLYAVTGRLGRYMRPPAGEWDSTVVAIADSLGLMTVLWDISSGDPDPKVTAEHMVEWVVGQVKPGSIVLFHMNTRGWHTAEAMPEIVTRLRRRGFRLVTLSEMIARTAN